MDGNVQEEQHPRKIGRLQRGYKVYVLLLLMLLYLVNQMDRFVLGVGSRGISRDLEFGEMTCHSDISLANGSCQDECTRLSNQTKLAHAPSGSALPLYQYYVLVGAQIMGSVCGIILGLV